MEAIRLRWLGQQLGLEKMVLKKGTLIGTFIADQKHRFFESDTFQTILQAHSHLWRVHVHAYTAPAPKW
jgi:transcription-repair coupling factor (superfamily II helicase)